MLATGVNVKTPWCWPRMVIPCLGRCGTLIGTNTAGNSKSVGLYLQSFDGNGVLTWTKNFKRDGKQYIPTRHAKFEDWKFVGNSLNIWNDVSTLIVCVIKPSVFKKCIWTAVHFKQLKLIYMWIYIFFNLTTKIWKIRRCDFYYFSLQLQL